MISLFAYALCLSIIGAAAMVYHSDLFGIYSTETHEYEEVECDGEAEYEEEGQDHHSEREDDEGQVWSMEKKVDAERYPYQRRSHPSISNPPTRGNPYLAQADFVCYPTYSLRPDTGREHPHRPAVLSRPHYPSSFPSSSSCSFYPPLSTRKVYTACGPERPSSPHQPHHFPFLPVAPSITDSFNSSVPSSNEELQQQIPGQQQGVYQPSHETRDVEHDMENEVMEDADMISHIDDEDIEMDSDVTPAPAPVTPIDALLQTALQNQAALEEKIHALIELERLFHMALPEIARQSMITFAQTLVTQVTDALNVLENHQNESPLSQVDAKCLRFWTQTLASIDTQSPASTATSNQDDTQNQSPASTTSPSTPSETSTSDVDIQSQASFLDALSAPIDRRRGSSGGDALHYSYSAAKSSEAGPSRTPRHGYHNLKSQRKEKTTKGIFSGGESLKAGSDRNTARPLPTTLPYPSTLSGGGVSRRRVPQDGQSGSENDVKRRLEWESVLDTRLKKSQAKREAKAKEKERAQSGAASTSTTTAKKRGFEEMQGSDDTPNTDANASESPNNDTRSQQDYDTGKGKGKGKERAEPSRLSKRVRLDEGSRSQVASTSTLASPSESASTSTPTSEQYEAERLWHIRKYGHDILRLRPKSKRKRRVPRFR